MKSKVKFDLSIENKPIILAEIEESEDVRDKIAYRFSKAIGYESLFGYIKFNDHENVTGRAMIIEPINDNLNDLQSLKNEVEWAIQRVQAQNKSLPKVKK